jgi:hypothetical protein
MQDDKTLLLSGYFESDFDELMDKLVKSTGTVFDALFRHVQHPPAMPVSSNVADFASWIRQHCVIEEYSLRMKIRIGFEGRTHGRIFKKFW